MPRPKRRLTVAITGASAGVGRAAAVRFARDGARVGLIARDPAGLEAAAEEVRRAGGEALTIGADVADADAVDAAAAAVEEAFGPLDVWVNNAMATVFGPFSDIPPEDFRRATEVTYLGCVHGSRAALARMRPRDRGTIVQVGSALAHRSIPLQAAYCGAKHAIVGFTDSLRCELLHERSRVSISMVHLPAVNTPQFDWGRNYMPRRPQPLPPIFQPEVAAEAIRLVALRPRRELWVGWPTVQAMLGQKLLPRLLDRIFAQRAWNGQQTAEPAEAGPDNLYEPVPGERSAHGRFDDRARARSRQLDLLRRLGPLAPGALMDMILLRR